jgi:hypothetical protein
MATYQKFQNFVEDLGKGVHNFTTHTLKAALTNTAPNVTDTILANITQISATGGYSAGGYTLDTVVWSETGGTGKLTIADEVITASGGSVGPFRYVVIYNDTPTSPADPLICFYDYGSSITLANTETLTIDFDGTNGVFTLA